MIGSLKKGGFMQFQHIKNILIFAVLIGIYLFVGADQIQAAAPIVNGSVRMLDTEIGAPYVWVKWTDNNNHIRYTQADINGRYSFPSWQALSDDDRNILANTKVNTNFDGTSFVNQATTSDREGSFGCDESPHTFTAIKPVNWNGTFNTITIAVGDFNNGDYTLDNKPLYFTPYTPPTISGLRIYNSGASQPTPSAYRVSGNQSGPQGGSGLLNPMTITLNAKPGVLAPGSGIPSATISKYYVAFYKKPDGAYTTTFIGGNGNPTDNIKNLLSANYNDGFILAYGSGIKTGDTGNNHYVWDPRNNIWINITEKEYGQDICGPSNGPTPDCANLLYYTASSGNPYTRPTPDLTLAHSWTILLDKNFGTKNMYTAGYVIDSNYVPAFLPDINPPLLTN